MSDRLLPGAIFLLAACAAVPAAAERLPDGGTARAAGTGIVSARYEDPTTRYDHGILGDTVEAGALTARDAGGAEHRVVLPASEVFEDLTPRLADLDGDGGAEIVTIRSSVSRGASLAVYGLRGGQLELLAATPFLGRPHRWLCPAGIADFDSDGRLELALVTTPHIGGTLEFWRLEQGRLRQIASLSGFSNHVIGSRDLSEAAAGDIDGDGSPELVLPDAARTSLVAVSLRGGRAAILDARPVGSAISGPVRLSGRTADVQTALGQRAVTFVVPNR
ncbi:MAG: FG-GAP repeat domain-containing protein [Flavobacteriaceae bacterium]